MSGDVALADEELREDKEEEKKVEDDDESFIWGQGPGEREMYGERSLEDEEEMEEGKSAPSTATITAAEKSEEEVRDVMRPDHVLAEMQVEVRINLSFTIVLPVELLCLTTFVIS